MINKVIIALLILIALGVGIVLFQSRTAKEEILPAENFIPERSGVIIKANGLLPLVALLNENDFICSEAFQCRIGSIHQSLDSLSGSNELASEVLNDRASWLVILPGEKSDGFLFLTNIGSELSVDKLESLLLPVFERHGYKCYQYISGASPESDSASLYFTVENGVLIIGSKPEFIHESLLCQSGGSSVLKDSAFNKVYGTSGANASGTVYFNFESASRFLKKALSSEAADKAGHFFCKNGWIALDVNISAKKIIFQGFSFASGSSFIASELLKTDQAVDNSVFDMVPSNIAFLSCFSMSDPYSFTLMKNEYAKKNKNFREQIALINEATGFDINEKIAEIISSAAGFFLQVNKSGFEPFFILKTKSRDDAYKFIEKMDGTEIGDSVLLAKLKSDKIPYLIAGEAVENLKFNFAINYQDFVVFAENEIAIRHYADSVKNKITLANDSVFSKVLQDLILSKSNLSHIIFPSACMKYFSDWFDESAYTTLVSKFKNSNSIIGIQLSGNDPMVYCNAFHYSERSDSVQPDVEWQHETDTGIYMMQQINFGNNGTSFFIQDYDDNIYLISSLGRVIWKKQIDGPVLGTIHPIDFYKNRKTQIVFNTAQQLYIIDKNGNNVDDFPVKFKSRATNGIAVADFDHDRDYRFYLSFENKSFVALTKEGRKVEGWQTEKTGSPVHKPAQCFTHEGKDYIAFFDSTQIFLLNRKGESRLRKKLEISSLGKNSELLIEKKNLYFRMLIQDKSSKLHIFYPDGKKETKEINSLFENVQIAGFEQGYLAADSSKLIFLDHRFQETGSFTPDDAIHGKIVLNRDENHTFIAFANSSLKQINLLSSDGKKLKASPIFGDYPFIFISLSDGSGSRMLCSSGNQIIYYTLP